MIVVPQGKSSKVSAAAKKQEKRRNRLTREYLLLLAVTNAYQLHAQLILLLMFIAEIPERQDALYEPQLPQEITKRSQNNKYLKKVVFQLPVFT